uniref:Uncharacterized protein n=1 Tax=Anguilla anguilla TaxID=7936 RepID=A0A0E9TQ12_ANGAN
MTLHGSWNLVSLPPSMWQTVPRALRKGIIHGCICFFYCPFIVHK